ncbi:flavin reductase family protein [Phreatobacter stygius]|uniref:Flavin reductase family protein n=2 Tax=Phreatobacter stygius TaxID=1940610 RepID=A0A4D7B5U7_9HYPH|nr:flavin reductase family protein [Phreatobacter stygius]
MRSIALDTLPDDRVYKILCSLVIPRPIALVSSMSAKGEVNAAPFSFFNVFSEAPPLVVLGLQHKPDHSAKDTTLNIQETGEFVVNLVDEALAEAMNICATDFPAEVSEIAAAGLTTAASTLVKPPRIAEAPAALECRREVSLAFGPQRELLVGRVMHVHVREDVMNERFDVDIEAYKPIGRLYGNLYTRQHDVFALNRVSYADWQASQANKRTG